MLGESIDLCHLACERVYIYIYIYTVNDEREREEPVPEGQYRVERLIARRQTVCMANLLAYGVNI